MPDYASQLVRELTPSPVFPAAVRDEVLRSLHQMSNALPINFPESMCGARVIERVVPGLLLCFRRNAGLDMTLVVVDSGGGQHFPGTGTMLRLEEDEGGVRRQVLRDGEAEQAACEQVVRVLDEERGFPR